MALAMTSAVSATSIFASSCAVQIAPAHTRTASLQLTSHKASSRSKGVLIAQNCRFSSRHFAVLRAVTSDSVNSEGGEVEKTENEEKTGEDVKGSLPPSAPSGGGVAKTLGLLSQADLIRKKAKKERKRKNRLVRKRKLRKKGRWPPSKLKKGSKV